MGPKGSILISDVTGIVVATGSGTPSEKFKICDCLCSSVHRSSYSVPENDAFSEYCAIDANIAFELPSNIL